MRVVQPGVSKAPVQDSFVAEGLVESPQIEGRPRAMRHVVADTRAALEEYELAPTTADEFAVSGSSSLPLGPRDQKWDAAAADKAVRAWADATEKPNAKYASAFFYKAGDGTKFGDFKLGFAQPVDGTLTANWGGVTAVAGALSGARGGVNIPDSDKAGIKAKVKAYYSKAAKAYDDPEIKVPWEASDQASVRFGDEHGLDVLYASDGEPTNEQGRYVGLGGDFNPVELVEVQHAAMVDALAYASVGVDEPVLLSIARLRWEQEFAAGEDALAMGACANCEHAYDMHPADGACTMLGCACEMYEETPVTDGEAAAQVGYFSIVDPNTPDAAPVTLADWVASQGLTLQFQTVTGNHVTSTTGFEVGVASPGDGGIEIREPESPGAVEWTAIFAPEGKMTSDGRAFAPGSITWRELPLTLMAMTETSEGGHIGAEVAGKILDIWRDETAGLIRAKGVFDTGEYGQEIARLVADQTLRGVSVDLAIEDYEVGARSEWFDEDGNWAPNPNPESADKSIGEILFGDEGAEPTVAVVKKAELGMTCHSADTELLTESGWKRFPELKRGERVATRNQLTKAIEYHEATYFHAERFEGKMLRFSNSRNLDLLVTPNHRMLVVNRNGDEMLMRASELASQRRGQFGIPLVAGWHDQEEESFTIESEQIPAGMCACGCGSPTRTRVTWEGGGRSPGTIARTLPGHGHGLNTDPLTFSASDFAAFMGMWLAEGSIVQNRPGAIFISQMQKSRGYAAYSNLLERMFGKVKHDGRCFVIKNARLWRYLRQFGRASEKFVPAEIKAYGRPQLQAFLDHYLLGDGSKDHANAFTSSPQLADDLQEIAQKIGMWARILPRPNDGDTVMSDGRIIKKENKKPQYRISFRNRSIAERANRASWLWTVDEVEYADMVYCVSVPNEVFYVRRNGLPAWSGNTVCPFPAFREAKIVVGDSLIAGANPAIWTVVGQAGWTAVAASSRPVTAFDASGDGAPCLDCGDGTEALSASVAGVAVDAPPVEWFDMPEADEATPLTVTEDGQVYGHAALWGTCHIGIPGRCQPPPESNTEYAYFHLGEVLCENGERVHAGTITLDTGHASTGLSRADATRHYDDTGTAVAYVKAHDGEHGIWVSGALRGDVPADKVALLRGGKLSGDWRNVDGNLELVALLTVNVPGFPVPAPKQLVASGEVVSLVAAGIPIFEADIEPEYRERFAALKAHAEFAALAAEAV